MKDPTRYARSFPATERRAGAKSRCAKCEDDLLTLRSLFEELEGFVRIRAMAGDTEAGNLAKKIEEARGPNEE